MKYYYKSLLIILVIQYLAIQVAYSTVLVEFSIYWYDKPLANENFWLVIKGFFSFCLIMAIWVYLNLKKQTPLLLVAINAVYIHIFLILKIDTHIFHRDFEEDFFIHWLVVNTPASILLAGVAGVLQIKNTKGKTMSNSNEDNYEKIELMETEIELLITRRNWCNDEVKGLGRQIDDSYRNDDYWETKDLIKERRAEKLELDSKIKQLIKELKRVNQ